MTERWRDLLAQLGHELDQQSARIKDLELQNRQLLDPWHHMAPIGLPNLSFGRRSQEYGHIVLSTHTHDIARYRMH